MADCILFAQNTHTQQQINNIRQTDVLNHVNMTSTQYYVLVRELRINL